MRSHFFRCEQEKSVNIGKAWSEAWYTCRIDRNNIKVQECHTQQDLYLIISVLHVYVYKTGYWEEVIYNDTQIMVLIYSDLTH